MADVLAGRQGPQTGGAGVKLSEIARIHSGPGLYIWLAVFIQVMAELDG
jgi:hypothetical protein